MTFTARRDEAPRKARKPDAPPTVGASLVSSPTISAAKAGPPSGARRRIERPARFLAAPSAAPPLRILVVEDDALIQMLLCETLIALGHEVCAAAATEADAVAAATRSAPDLMIVDIHLAVGSGTSAVRRILAERHVAHIVVSGDASAAANLAPGAVALQKPYQEHDLVRAIAAAMNAG